MLTGSGVIPRPPTQPMLRPPALPSTALAASGPPPGNARTAPLRERIPANSGMARLRARVARDSTSAKASRSAR